jgi:hypothetical protein
MFAVRMSQGGTNDRRRCLLASKCPRRPGAEAVSLKDIAYTKISLTELELLRTEIKRLRTERAYIAETLYGELRTDNARLRAPITMQDIRLCAGEGKLSAATVLQATNAVLRMRSSLRPKP